MSTLAEIEEAADTLPPEQQQELLLSLATRLHGKGGRFRRRATSRSNRSKSGSRRMRPGTGASSPGREAVPRHEHAARGVRLGERIVEGVVCSRDSAPLGIARQPVGTGE